jgi:hypothetical protein
MLAVNRSRDDDHSRYRRLAGVTSLVSVLLVLVVIASLLALSHLSPKVVSGTPGSSVTSTSASTTTLGTGQTTIPQSGAIGGTALSILESTSRNGPLITSVGQGGQRVLLMRTTALSFITNPGAKPVVEYFWRATCDACGTENLVVATSLLELGGTFSGLRPQSIGSRISSVGFGSVRYHGPVVFEPVEMPGATGGRASALSRQAQAQYALYDRSPYTKGVAVIPFLDVASHFVATASGIPSRLVSGDTLRTITTALHAGHSRIAQAILGSANILTAAICTTLTQLSCPLPPVCFSGMIQQLESSLPTSPPAH